MLIPLTREKLEQLIPLIATSQQYSHYWGKWQDLLNRLLISVVAIVVILIIDLIIGESGQALLLLLGAISGLYWLWCPVYLASTRNSTARRFKYGGFWQGKVVEVYLTEELIGEEETVNKRGELVIVENRERWINVVLVDETGFELEVHAPLKRIHKAITTGQVAQLVVLSNRPDLSAIDKISDAYFPKQNLWLAQYPWLARDVFLEVSRELGNVPKTQYRRKIKRSQF
ncbi:hypothetical protein [Myxosarcina sp. GI1]|uniref:hypothetical protein n=1 Tax=Myxosarcina sp. GI1 TaxID=1541065 RepID=UPI0005667F43|nr:hypothetical protein [Myxosarcina sp. GI1]